VEFGFAFCFGNVPQDLQGELLSRLYLLALDHLPVYADSQHLKRRDII
jgi:hypothetical protein